MNNESSGEAMRIWGPLSAAIHIASIIAIALLFGRAQLVDPALYGEAKSQAGLDAIHIASQLGRLDIVSLILAMFGLLVGIAAIFGFIEVRSGARDAASEVAKAEAKAHMDKYLNDEAPTIIRTYVELIIPPIQGPSGDDVADAYREREKPKEK